MEEKLFLRPNLWVISSETGTPSKGMGQKDNALADLMLVVMLTGKVRAPRRNKQVGVVREVEAIRAKVLGSSEITEVEVRRIWWGSVFYVERLVILKEIALFSIS